MGTSVLNIFFFNFLLDAGGLFPFACDFNLLQSPDIGTKDTAVTHWNIQHDTVKILSPEVGSMPKIKILRGSVSHAAGVTILTDIKCSRRKREATTDDAHPRGIR